MYDFRRKINKVFTMTTHLGRVVYDRPKHEFNLKDVHRILKAIQENDQYFRRAWLRKTLSAEIFAWYYVGLTVIRIIALLVRRYRYVSDADQTKSMEDWFGGAFGGAGASGDY